MTTIKLGVIPAAGLGTRMGYLSLIMPKCMFPVYDRPIIHHILDHMVNLGVEETFVIVNYQKEKIMEYFRQVKDDVSTSLEFVEQNELKGIADALFLVRSRIHEPFLTILGDDCSVTKSFSNLARLFQVRGASVVEGVVHEKRVSVLRSTCCVKLDREKHIVEIEEKPRAPATRLRGCGVYVFDPVVFDFIREVPPSKRSGHVELTEVIGRMATNGSAFGEQIQGTNININSYDDLLEASELLSKSRVR